MLEKYTQTHIPIKGKMKINKYKLIQLFIVNASQPLLFFTNIIFLLDIGNNQYEDTEDCIVFCTLLPG